MEFDKGRRRFLELAGTGTALSLAGCSAVRDSLAPDGEPDETEVGRAVVTTAVTVDQQKLQRRRQEIQSELDSGNITRREAQRRFQKVQTDLRSQAVASFVERVKSDSALAVRDSVDQFGVVLVAGSPAGLVDLLSGDNVQGLFSKETFQRAKRQAEQRGSPTPSSNSS